MSRRVLATYARATLVLAVFALLTPACAQRGADRPPLWTEVIRDEASPSSDEAARFRSMWGRHLAPTTPSYDPITGRSLPRTRPPAR